MEHKIIARVAKKIGFANSVKYRTAIPLSPGHPKR